MIDGQRVLDLVGLAGALFGGLWAYVQFVAKPAIIAEVSQKFVSKEFYALQNEYIIKDLTEIKAEIKEIRSALGGGYEQIKKP